MDESQHPEGAMPEAEPSGAETVEATPEVDSPDKEVDDQEILDQEDELAQLRNELAEVGAREAQYLDGWQRARAELDNARKRFRREQEQTWTVAQADILARVLAMVDDLERAVETLPEELSDHAWAGGVVLIKRKLDRIMEQAGVEPLEAEGLEFDPATHQAVTHESSATVPAGHVIAEMQRGYRMGERILRPSMVRVSSGPEPEVEVEPEPVMAPESIGEAQEPSERN